jgi:hypothetical protein
MAMGWNLKPTLAFKFRELYRGDYHVNISKCPPLGARPVFYKKTLLQRYPCSEVPSPCTKVCRRAKKYFWSFRLV